MEMQINHNTPNIIHVDLNSCFATMEQQAHPHLRGKPIGVAAYNSPGGCILAPSYEAKRLGVKTGMTVREAKLLCKDIIILSADPTKYRDAHQKLKKIVYDYTPKVTPKSIDELVLDFSGMEWLKCNLEEIGYDIKKRVKQDIGEWVTCNVGISTNRFLAKLAASLHKPDGLDIITYKNLEAVYKSLQLVDLNGINKAFEARLNHAGIYSPVEFLKASEYTLKKEVFFSINGYHWYLRLRGFETDAIDFGRKSYGQDYALQKPTNSPQELSRLLMKLCEKMGRRLRRAGCVANGIHLACIYKDRTHWHRGRMLNTAIFTTPDLHTKAIWLLNQQPQWKIITNLSVSCYALEKNNVSQMMLFDDVDKKKKMSETVDNLNNKYGEFTITPALMMGMGDLILDRIAFGGIKELEDIYLSG